MIRKKLETQYDNLGDAFIERHSSYNQSTDQHFYSVLPYLRNARLLDAGCGDGSDLSYYERQGAICTALDSSIRMVAEAKSKGVKVVLGSFENLPFEDYSFDIVVSKFAIQTSKDAVKVVSELGRVVKADGTLQYLSVHPLRQFLERKRSHTNYFKQMVVNSRFFDRSVNVREPTHTFNDYFNQEFLSKFDIIYFSERAQPFRAYEHISGNKYPSYFIIRARKRHIRLTHLIRA